MYKNSYAEVVIYLGMLCKKRGREVMKNKKILLASLLTLSTGTLLVAEQTTHNTQQENATTPEQRFICEKQGDDGGVVCQMYECANEDCHPSNPLKLNDNQTTKNSNKDFADSVSKNIDISSDNNEEIKKLEREIKDEERTCGRAASDPREKSICERASANVLWRQEKIEALKGANGPNR